MNRSTFVKVAAALGVACSLATPATAQVTTALQGLAFGSGGINTGFSALSTTDGTVTTVTGTGANAQSSSITTTGGAGGKVGTFQASLSEGDQQRFAVGTSTNIGVNASSSSTSDYQANSSATFGIGSSNLRQTIGTSGISETSNQRAAAASSYAATAVETEIGNSAERYYEKASASGNTSSSNSNWAWWNNTYSGKSWNQLSQSEQQSVTSSYNQASSAITQRATSEYNSSASASEAANGVISGSFVSSSSQTGVSGTPPNANDANNQVTVKGIGNAASVNAQSSSSFSSVITARPGTPEAGTSGTASGSAGANVSSTASADAAATKFSSIFIQSY